MPRPTPPFDNPASPSLSFPYRYGPSTHATNPTFPVHSPFPMRLLLAADAPASTTSTNVAAVPLVKPPADLVQRISDATGAPFQVVNWTANVVAAGTVLLIGYWVANAIRNLIRKVCEARNLDPTIGGFVANLAHAMLMTFVVITSLGVVGVPTQNFTAIVAAAGLAIAFALQSSLANFANGFLLVSFRPFKKGDQVAAGGIEGVVDEISIFSTTVTTSDNKRIIVPNSAIMGGNIINHTANDVRRVELQFGVGATHDLAKAHSILVSTASADPRVRKSPPPAAANTRLIDGGTQVELRCWCRTSEYGDLTSDLIAKLPAALAAAGIKGPDKTVAYRRID